MSPAFLQSVRLSVGRFFQRTEAVAVRAEHVAAYARVGETYVVKALAKGGRFVAQRRAGDWWVRDCSARAVVEEA